MSKQKNFILLRGLTREQRHWGDFPQRLQESYPQCKIINLDLPGAGTWHREQTPLSVEQITLKLREEIDPQLLHKNKFIFIGVSLGGMVALNWGQHFPQDLEGMVIINSSAAGLCPLWKRLRPAAYSTLLRTVIHKNKRHEIIFDRVCAKKENKKRMVELWSKIDQESPVSLLNAIKQIFAAARFRLSEEIKIPGVILTAKNDNLVSSECSSRLAHFLNWPLRTHPWGGHELADDDPEWVLNEVKKFTAEEHFADHEALIFEPAER